MPAVEPEEATQRAARLIEYADGLEEGGYDGPVCGRIRVVARDVLDLAEQLIATESAYLVLKARYEDCLTIIGKAAYEEATREAQRRA